MPSSSRPMGSWTASTDCRASPPTSSDSGGCPPTASVHFSCCEMVSAHVPSLHTVHSSPDTRPQQSALTSDMFTVYCQTSAPALYFSSLGLHTRASGPFSAVNWWHWGPETVADTGSRLGMAFSEPEVSGSPGRDVTAEWLGRCGV